VVGVTEGRVVVVVVVVVVDDYIGGSSNSDMGMVDEVLGAT
jgi:hypothetical protein